MDKEYFYLNGDTKTGPFSFEALKRAPINPDTLVWHSALPDWVPARTLPELQALFASDGTSNGTAAEANYNRREPNYNTAADRPVTSSAPQPAPSAFEAAGKTNTASAYNPNVPRPPMPENYLVWAILATIFCCIPLGIMAIINSSKVSSAYAAGDYEGAMKASKDAKKWALWTTIIGGVFILLYFIFVFAAALVGAMN